MTQVDLSLAIAVNIPPTLTLTVTYEQLVQLAIAKRDLQLEQTANGACYAVSGKIILTGAILWTKTDLFSFR